jgi:hypothetical protein
LCGTFKLADIIGLGEGDGEGLPFKPVVLLPLIVVICVNEASAGCAS